MRGHKIAEEMRKRTPTFRLCLDSGPAATHTGQMYRSLIMNGFARLWAALLLSLMLASTPSMAAHMDGYSHSAAATLEIEQEQVEPGSDQVEPSEVATDCQDVCCTGTCVSAHAAAETEHTLDSPRMHHSGTSAVESFSARIADLLRPPKTS